MARQRLFTATGAKIFPSGAITFEAQTANKVYASPNGSTDYPSFRALVAADIPVLGAANLADRYRQPVRVMTTANVDIASAPASIDTYTLSSGDRVLLTNQSTGSQNGIWVFNGTGNALTRPTDYAAGSTALAVYGLTVAVLSGVFYGGSFAFLTYPTTTITIDSTATSWNNLPIKLTNDGVGVTGILSELNGGTHQSSYAQGDILYASNTDVLSRLAKGAAFQLLRMNSGATVPEWGQVPYIHLQDQKTQNTAGGTFTSGSLQTRTLNTEVQDTDNLCSLSSNQFTLAAGTYFMLAFLPCFKVNRNYGILYNVTGSATLITGRPAFNGVAATNPVTDAIVSGPFTVAASQALELQHQCATTKTTNGFGLEANFATEIYADIHIWRTG